MALNGTLIKESLADESVLDLLEIKKVEIWKAENHTAKQPKYWTAISFCTKSENFPEDLAKALKPEWYVDMSNGKEKIIALPGQVFRYPLGDPDGKRRTVEACRRMGIPESQIDWGE